MSGLILSNQERHVEERDIFFKMISAGVPQGLVRMGAQIIYIMNLP